MVLLIVIIGVVILVKSVMNSISEIESSLSDFDIAGILEEVSLDSNGIVEMSGDDIDLNMEELIKTANEFFGPSEYQYLGSALYLDEDGIPRDAYVPCDGETDFQLHRVTGRNHGVAITTWVTRDYADGRDAVERLTGKPPMADTLSSDIFVSDIYTADNDTIGIRFYAIFDPAGTYVQMVYADIRDDGYYMISLIDLYGPEYDSETAALIEEINDCYSFNLPTEAARLENFIK